MREIKGIFNAHWGWDKARVSICGWFELFEAQAQNQILVVQPLDQRDPQHTVLFKLLLIERFVGKLEIVKVLAIGDVPLCVALISGAHAAVNQAS